MNKKNLVVIGNGMAGARVVEEILKRAPDLFEIVMFGAEPYGNYNRILLSNVLNGTDKATDIFMNPLSWYEEKGIKLHAGVKVVKIDRARKTVFGIPLAKEDCPYASANPSPQKRQTFVENYDNLIIATGSRPFVPPIEGFGGPGTFLFRTLDDCARIADYAANCQRATVIGGGLLGLEAARGLLTHGVQVSVIEAAPHLMPVQLDNEGGRILQSTMEAMGIAVYCRQIVKEIQREEGKITRLLFHDGTILTTDMVVVSTGIRPIVEMANEAGIGVGRGILTNDQMRTNDENIFAVGECVEHRGQLYGLVEPIWEQARTLADVITGINPQAVYTGSKTATKLKVMGVELVSMGEKDPANEKDEVVTYREPNRGVYQKLIIREDRLAGAILLGQVQASDHLLRVLKDGNSVSPDRTELLFGRQEDKSLTDVLLMPDSLQICNCNGVTKEEIRKAIREENCTSVLKVGLCTRAGQGCGSCKNVIFQLIRAYADDLSSDPKEHYYVSGVPLEKSQLIAAIREKKLKSVSQVFKELAGGREDAASKVGLASLLRSLAP